MPSKPSSTSLHKLSWVGLFLVAGALASWVVFGRNGQSEPTVEAAEGAAPVAAARADGARADGARADGARGDVAPAVERRSLMAEGQKPNALAEAEPIGQATAADERRDDGATARSGFAPASGGGFAPTAAKMRMSSLAAETRAALMRGNANPRVARAAASPLPRGRKRPARAETAETASNTDAELDGMFTSPEPERPRGGDGELDGMFPRDEGVTVGANGAPLPD